MPKAPAPRWAAVATWAPKGAAPKYGFVQSVHDSEPEARAAFYAPDMLARKVKAARVGQRIAL